MDLTAFYNSNSDSYISKAINIHILQFYFSPNSMNMELRLLKVLKNFKDNKELIYKITSGYLWWSFNSLKC